MAGPLARLSGVTKSFGDVHALTNLDLEVRPGEVFGLLGPNGAGKTTTVRLMCGLVAPDAGTVEIAGMDVQRRPLDARRHLAFVPDGAPLYVHLSPRQHLELVARLHDMPEAELAGEAERLLECLDLGARIDDPVGQFSRGMRQKTALACALIARPQLLILDEPLAGLDAPSSAVLKEVLREWAERGGSVLYTSHLLDVVERVCDRMQILVDGKSVGVGTLDELRSKAGLGGSLEQVFGALAASRDPREQARRLLDIQ